MNEQLATNGSLAIIEKKRSSWALMGETIYKQELELQARAQAALSKLVDLPITIDDVPAAEATLKEVKNLCAQIQADRKLITGKFDPVFERLMAPEKSFAVPVNAYMAAIIAIKKEQEKTEETRRKKADEIARIRQTLITALARYDAEFKTLITEKVNTAFTWALEHAVKPEEVVDYRDRISFRIVESLFKKDPPEINLQYATHEEFNTILNELWRVNPADYVALFIVELEKKFSDYHIAFNNKQDALRQSKEEQERRLREIEAHKQQQEVAAHLDAVSTDLSVEPSGIKALKKSYEVDVAAMGETVQTVIKIMAAFSANLQQCLTKLKVNKWMSFTPHQAATALAKLKCDDNQFAPAGILWKEVDKL